VAQRSTDHVTIRMHSLMYHDVYSDAASPEDSGFPGAGAAVYKLPCSSFKAHLERLANTLATPPSILTRPDGPHDLPDPGSWSLTFDDGGVSAFDLIAPLLEERGWRGHFFITTSRIGEPGFLNPSQIRSLHERGHRIGSHSHTHPERISALTPPDIALEWSASLRRLSEIVGEKVFLASVPGGYYSAAVGAAAAEVGVRILFHSEPVHRASRVGAPDCVLLGRYAIKGKTSAQTAASLALGSPGPRFRMRFCWSLRGVAKRLSGAGYVRLRRSLLKNQGTDIRR
jgi:peptidoglycan/xylan/chitin deacetylase (PgdA/CDA1 family)